jgi:sugar phosphate isomerase/epimerase
MIFGYSTNAYVKFTLFEAIERIANLGFKAVEIMGDRPHLYPPDFEEENLVRLKGLVEKLDLKVININSFTLFAVGDTYLPSWIEPDADRREIRIRHTIESLKVADYLGCKSISIPPGGPLDGMAREDAMPVFLKGLERVIPLAEELNIKVLVEPEPDLLIERTQEFQSFIKEVKSDIVGINFDIGHFFCVGEDPKVAFETLFEWVGHVHIEDIGSNREHNHLIAGQGVIQFLEIFEAMQRLGYNGDISLELYPYVDMPDEAGQKSLEYLCPVFKEAGLKIEA